MSKVIKRLRGGATILCPKCKTPTRVLQTRRINDVGGVWRERSCPKCQMVIETSEKLERRVAA